MEATLQAVLDIMGSNSKTPLLSGVERMSTYMVEQSLIARGYSQSSVSQLMHRMDKNRNSFIERTELPDLVLIQNRLDSWDTDKNGKVTSAEFMAALSKDMQLTASQRKLYELAFKELDADGDGKLSSLEAFDGLEIGRTGSKSLSDEQLQRILAELGSKDLNNDGKVTVGEFSDIIGPYLTKEDLQALLKKINLNNDCQITFVEYLKDYYLDWIAGR
ncbi:EF-hand domain-containing protein [Pseudomonas sp. 148P]|uniref:EF-hand domain-containing protein n=1 Tax=Pseudomonas ulcerans TaxID=3115852 RepID=A0ABU7HVG4_9PSED|nr:MULTISPECIES: EF-hand domain-containing protein [unclassified Pseudomonas]MEE1924332.1 EF-hand domain-containing protein [Pseudomonas sp. 147P]MEE1935501.1 EF-hand domain-containing protein [Pseudomonas sp. 148P]